jgi:hypothetical protein
METPKEYYYTYYSYEEWGRGYFGSRKCYCLPEEDITYLGSSKDKTFKPKYKIILKDDYATREDAYADEIILQEHYKVVENPHFANKAYQTSTKFYVPKEQAIENGKKSIEKQKELSIGIYALSQEQVKERNRKIVEKNKENGVSIFKFSKEELSENGKRGGKIAGEKSKENKTGIFKLSKEERNINSSNGGKLAYELGLGIHSFTPEQKSEAGKKGLAKLKEENLGIFAMTAEERSDLGKRNYNQGIGCFSLTPEKRSEVSRKVAYQKWMCLETGFITNAGNLTKYQKARGIDTSKRVKIS